MIRKEHLLALTFLMVVYFVVSPGLILFLLQRGYIPWSKMMVLQFNATLWGDEWSHGWETTDGYSIIFDETTKNWVYAIPGIDGNLVPSTNIVGKRFTPRTLFQSISERQENLHQEIQKLRSSQALDVPAQNCSGYGNCEYSGNIDKFQR